ncbi:MAG: hypothetical protein P9L91_06995 [Candidatus Zophobacter franzmannii]|nr:hypothetical protein [Candidatus Zophobacter franzmannii]
MQEEIKYLIKYEAFVQLYITLTAFFGNFIKSCRGQMRYRWLIILCELCFALAIKQYRSLIPFHPLVLRL